MDDLLQEMIQPAGPTGHDRARRRRLVMSAATVGLAVVGVTSLTTSALFSDNDSAVGSAFTTGSVDISKTPNETAILSALNLAPGDTVWGPVTVANDGSLGFRYAVGYFFTDVVRGPASEPLSSQLSLTIDKVADAASCNPVTGPTTGTRLGAVNAPDASTTDVDLVGTRAQGKNPAPNTELVLDVDSPDDVLCVGVHMSIDAINVYQKTSADLTVTFNAEQTANN